MVKPQIYKYSVVVGYLISIARLSNNLRSEQLITPIV